MNIIVTGASKGIGYEAVKRFSENSSNRIVAISRNLDNLNLLKQECLHHNPDSMVYPFQFDLQEDDYQPVKDYLLYHFESRVDILLNNAGLLINKPFDELKDEDFDSMFSVNVKSAYKLIKILLPFFKKNAHIVNISSMGGFQGSAKFPGLSLYSASKGALAILTECLAEELKDKKISANCLAIGAVQTEMLEAAFPGYKAPLSAEEMAVFLTEFAQSGHKFFNGKILPVSLSTP